jgi:hypothetical protein
VVKCSGHLRRRLSDAEVDSPLLEPESNFDFWNNIYRKCKSNSNFPHQLPELSVATSRRQWARRLHLPQLHSDTVYLKTMPHDV